MANSLDELGEFVAFSDTWFIEVAILITEVEDE
jgi:hypothetical protein